MDPWTSWNMAIGQFCLNEVKPGEERTVTVSRETADLLVSIGWTPPKE